MNFISIYESYDTFELDIIRIEFTKEEIIFRILNENTLQIGNVYALGNNGAIVQVQEEFKEQAELILSDLNIKHEHNSENDKFSFISFVEKRTDNIPFLKKLNISARIVFLFFFLISTPLLFLGFLSMKNTEQKLTSNKWCLNEIIYKGDILVPNTLNSFHITGFGCGERVEFKENKGIFLPGFQNNKSQGQWKYDKKDQKIIILNMFNNKEIYEGEYKIKLSYKSQLELESKNTKMKLSPWKY